VSKCGQRPNPVADDFSDRQHGHGEDRSGSTPHPKPEDERDDDENGIEDESPGKKHRSYQLAFDQVNCEVKPSSFVTRTLYHPVVSNVRFGSEADIGTYIINVCFAL